MQTNAALVKEWQRVGDLLLQGKIEGIELNGITYHFTPKQKAFIDCQQRYCLFYGGFGSGKTFALLMKLILMSLCFPKNRILLGRQYLSDVTRALLPDLFEILPSNLYKYRVKDNIISFFNGSEIILMGLDAMQSGTESNIKKAQQKIKSLNLGAFFIDQLEEIDKEVFTALTTRLRRTNVPFRQGNMTCNPANFWAYKYFKKDTKKNTFLLQSSTMDNKENLTQDYIDDLLDHSDIWVERYVKGTWSPDILVDSIVFGKEYIAKLKAMVKKPLKIRQGCEIYEEYKISRSYQMGVDPSEGSVDPSSISVISSDGKKVAKYNGFITIPGLINKVQFLYEEYGHPLIIPESNAAGAALVEGIKDLRVYKRLQFNYREKRQTEKLGFWTDYQSKQALIANFQKLLRINYPKIYDENTIDEFMTFIWTDVARQKGAGAQRNYHDDDVMSTLLGYWKLSPEIVAIRAARKNYKPINKKFQYF